MDDELKPCPFCGKSARIWQDPSHSAAFFVGCDDGETDCFGAIMWAESRAETIAAWNRRADLAQAPAPVLWTQAQQIAFARAYDAEDAAQRGEPTPWADGEDTGEWADERVACVRAGLAALEAPDAGVPCPHPDVYDSGNCCGGGCFAPDAGVVAELVEALRGMVANACAAASIKGKQHIIVCTEEEWIAHVAATERARALIAKLESRA